MHCNFIVCLFVCFVLLLFVVVVCFFPLLTRTCMKIYSIVDTVFLLTKKILSIYLSSDYHRKSLALWIRPLIPDYILIQTHLLVITTALCRKLRVAVILTLAATPSKVFLGCLVKFPDCSMQASSAGHKA